MENKFNEKWIIREVDWHEVIPHHYHVSQIGVGHSDLPPDRNHGPCLRQVFYRITLPKKHEVGTLGNLKAGTVIHRTLQEIQKLNVPHSIIEFPLFGKHKKITYSGSVDIVEFKKGTFMPIEIDIVDIKSASQYTLPKHEQDYNYTHFAQVYLYAFILSSFYMTEVVVKNLEIWYVNKHNYATHVLSRKYNQQTGKKHYAEFLQRCEELDTHLGQEVLPDKEPMRWCKYCDYRSLCQSDCISEDDILTYTEDEIETMYTKDTGKSPYWRGNRTKAFVQFRGAFKVE